MTLVNTVLFVMMTMLIGYVIGKVIEFLVTDPINMFNNNEEA